MPVNQTALIHPEWMMLAQADAAPSEVTGVLGAEGSEGGVESAPGSAAGGGAAPASPFGGFMLPLLLMMVVLMVFTALSSGRRQKKEKAERDAMLNSLSRSDRVEMIGGEIGTVVEIDAETVVVRVHEGTDTRVRYTRSAVKTVLRASGNSNATPEPEMDASDDKSAA